MSVRRRAAERGSAGIELVAGVPLLIVCGLFAIQFGLAGWATVATGDAARAAARAASLGQDGPAAARAALPAGLHLVSAACPSSGTSVSCTVTVRTPTITSALRLDDVSRTVDMPTTR